MGSKGLEFKSVIFIGLGHLSQELAEAECAKLLYVGMTRARQRLILTASAETPITDRLAAIAACKGGRPAANRAPDRSPSRFG